MNDEPKAYYYTVNYQENKESGFVLSISTDRAFRILLVLYGAHVDLIDLYEVPFELYNEHQKQKYETEPNTQHMQDIPSNLHGWRVHDN